MINPAPIQNALMVEGNLAFWGRPWATWFTQAFNILFADQQSGVTADRPTRNLWPGRPYFDTSLGTNGKKIFVDKNATGWVDSSGNAV